MQHAIVLGLLVLGPTPPTVALEPGAQAVLAEDGPNDLLMNPSRHTEGAARLGGTEIMNPPYESFGMMQKPTNPSTMDIRQAPTGRPVVSGAQNEVNRAEVHEMRQAAAEEAGLPVRNPVPLVTPEQAAADAANAQAAGVQAAVSSAKTSAAAAEAPPSGESTPPSGEAPPPATPSTRDLGEPDQPATPDGSTPTEPVQPDRDQ
jgi:hypothetical protein